ncbi:helix-turn-helix transcriptional regulator [Janthinobacterium agaricidamnosum]|uniref:Sensory box protein n=1 Tax=Janthinobacterium agaricidamnosum NBRC 102515 = DSM 9628 TaxID=1349767 RepID=W0V4J8_9BURK|nr:PAS domain-containing protein [Janthinobacterium agaricidamnosum]CDG82197.1 sensory box protein [Janthinobacterium agaricidamnosum NBRC 102515 = DSM 9628]
MSGIDDDVDARLRCYYPIASAISVLFHPQVEVLIHDLKTEKIAFIANPISKRKIGDSSLGDQFPDTALEEDVIGPYRKVNRDGRNLRSITAVLRDANQAPIAVMCINFDVSRFEDIAEQIKAFAFLPHSLEPHAPFFHDNWRQAMERAVQEQESSAGAPIKAMNAGQRLQLIRRLEADGLFNVRNAPPVIAERMGISRAALYKHLKTIRGGAAEPSEANATSKAVRTER